MINKNKPLSVKKIAAALLITIGFLPNVQASCFSNEGALLVLEAQQKRIPQTLTTAQFRSSKADFIEDLGKNAERDFHGNLPKAAKEKKLDLSKHDIQPRKSSQQKASPSLRHALEENRALEEEEQARKETQRAREIGLEILIPIGKLVSRSAELVDVSRMPFPRAN